MKLDCKITDLIQSDFNSLWKCKQTGDTLEISTPYLMPDSTLLSVFLTKRGDRYIVCDGGGLIELLHEHCELPEADLAEDLSGIAAKFRMKEGSMDGEVLYFRDCTDPKIISALVFEVANFAISAASALVFASPDGPLESPNRFQRRADAFLRSIKPDNLTLQPREISEVPGVQFGAVLLDKETHKKQKLWIVSFVTGSNPTYFRRSVCDIAMSFKHVWESPLKDYVGRTIPVVDTDAGGFKRDKLRWQLAELQTESHNSTVNWDNKERLSEMLVSTNGSSSLTV